MQWIKAMLENDYKITTVNSGKEAIMLFYRGYVPNLILLDLVMPDIDGWDVFNRIKAIGNLHHVPVALFTSSDDPQDRAKAKQIGADDYIGKPVKKSELLERVGKLIK